MSARRNVYIALSTQCIAALFSILATLLVSRFMPARDLGIFAVTMSLTAIIAVFQNSGAHEFLVYQRDDRVDLSMRRSAFGLSLATSLAVAGVLLVAGPQVAQFYSEPRMVPILAVLALQTAIGALASPNVAMLAREQRFQTSSLISLVSSITLSATQILYTMLDFGPIGLAWATVTSSAVFVILNYIWSREYNLFFPSFKNIKNIAGFGVKILGTNLMVQINNNLPQIILGRLLSLTDAALYSRANATTQIYSQTVARALDPIINARIAHEGRTQSSSSLIPASQAMLAISAPFFGFIAIFAPWFVPLMFGPQWQAAVLPTTILCWGFLIWPLASPISAVLLAAGRPGLLLRIRMINTIFRAAVVILLARWSLNLACAGISIGLYLYFAHGLIAMRDVVGISIRSYIASLGKSLLVSVVTLGACGAFVIFFNAYPVAGLPTDESVNAKMVAGGAALAAVAWFTSLALTRHFIWSEMIYLVESRLRRRG
jgi:O-antigen/teichoic acid export membrane protein